MSQQSVKSTNLMCEEQGSTRALLLPRAVPRRRRRSRWGRGRPTPPGGRRRRQRRGPRGRRRRRHDRRWSWGLRARQRLHPQPGSPPPQPAGASGRRRELRREGPASLATSFLRAPGVSAIRLIAGGGLWSCCRVGAGAGDRRGGATAATGSGGRGRPAMVAGAASAVWAAPGPPLTVSSPLHSKLHLAVSFRTFAPGSGPLR